MVYTSLVFNVAVPNSMSALFFLYALSSPIMSQISECIFLKVSLLLGSWEILTISKDKHREIFLNMLC